MIEETCQECGHLDSDHGNGVECDAPGCHCPGFDGDCTTDFDAYEEDDDTVIEEW